MVMFLGVLMQLPINRSLVGIIAYSFADALIKLSLENTRRAEGHVCTFP